MLSGLILGCRDYIWRKWLGHIGTSTRVLLSNHPLPYLGESEPHGCSVWVATIYGKRGTQTSWDGANVAASHNLKPDLSAWIWSGSQGKLPEPCQEICVWSANNPTCDPPLVVYLDLIPLTSTYKHQSSLSSPEFQWSSDGSWSPVGLMYQGHMRICPRCMRSMALLHSH